MQDFAADLFSSVGDASTFPTLSLASLVPLTCCPSGPLRSYQSILPATELMSFASALAAKMGAPGPEPLSAPPAVAAYLALSADERAQPEALQQLYGVIQGEQRLLQVLRGFMALTFSFSSSGTSLWAQLSRKATTARQRRGADS